MQYTMNARSTLSIVQYSTVPYRSSIDCIVSYYSERVCDTLRNALLISNCTTYIIALCDLHTGASHVLYLNYGAALPA
jgi:hypothetical protein